MKNDISLRYLPVFYDDVKNVIDYISTRLLNKKAAVDLVDDIEKAILDRLPVADSFYKFKSKKDRKSVYYKIDVKNYNIYYVVIKENKRKIMEVRRFLHDLQDIDNYI